MSRFFSGCGATGMASELTLLFREKLGEGSFGSVWSAEDSRTGQTVAVKVLPLDQDAEQILNELRTLREIEFDCPFIVRYHGSVTKDTELWLCMEYCDAGSVCDLMSICERE